MYTIIVFYACTVPCTGCGEKPANCYHGYQICPTNDTAECLVSYNSFCIMYTQVQVYVQFSTVRVLTDHSVYICIIPSCVVVLYIHVCALASMYYIVTKAPSLPPSLPPSFLPSSLSPSLLRRAMKTAKRLPSTISPRRSALLLSLAGAHRTDVPIHFSIVQNITG